MPLRESTTTRYNAMKLLEELKREQAAQSKSAVNLDRRARPRSPVSDAVQGAMKFLHGELSEFAHGLNQLKAGVRVSYEVDGVGTLKDLAQGGYNVVADSPDLPRFELFFRCVGQTSLHRVVNTAADREQLQRDLTQLGLKHQADDMSTWRYTVTVKPEINVRLLFSAAASGGTIRMEAHNLHRLGVELFSIEPSQINEALIEELGKMVLRRENRFAELSGNAVSDTMRQRLRERVQRRKDRQAKLADVVHKEIEAEHAGRKKLFRSSDPSSRTPRVRQAPRQAPIMVADDAPQDGWVNWDNSGAPALETGRVAEPAMPVATPMRQPTDDSDGAVTGSSPRYAWLITRDVRCADTAGTIAKRGPSGSQRAFPLPIIMNTGEPFRMKTREGEVRYLGSIAGEYQGLEPLKDFGHRHGCEIIEYQRGAEWVPVTAAR